jgi:hypothetical protein
MAALFRLLASKAGEGKKREQKPDQRPTAMPQASEPMRRAAGETDAERIRRFLEALGQPTTSQPPPPVAPRTNIPPPPLAPVQPPAVPAARNVLTRKKRQIVEPTKSVVPAPVFEIHEAPPSVPTVAIKSPVEAYAIATESRTDVARTKTYVATLVRSPAGLRNAVILREILGPPRGLTPLDLIGSA